MVKATFTFDESTARRLKLAAERLGKPKSQVVREAIRDYADRIGKLGERERLQMMKILDEMMARPPTRPQAEVDAELREIRRSRRTGWRGKYDR